MLICVFIINNKVEHLYIDIYISWPNLVSCSLNTCFMSFGHFPLGLSVFFIGHVLSQCERLVLPFFCNVMIKIVNFNVDAYKNLFHIHLCFSCLDAFPLPDYKDIPCFLIKIAKAWSLHLSF